MSQTARSTYLLASREPSLLAAVEPVLAKRGAHVEIALSADAVLSALMHVDAAGAPALVFVDSRLPDLQLGKLLAEVRARWDSRVPIVLFSDTVPEESVAWLQDGVLDDLLPTTLTSEQFSLRVEMTLRAHRRVQQLGELEELLARNDRIDRLTGAYTRDALLSVLFRETDRVQRMNTFLCLILFDIDDFGHWNARLGYEAGDQLLIYVADRVTRLLRTYDLLGRVGNDEFLIGLPGCTAVNAVLLAERVRSEVFGVPFSVAGAAIRMTACFGVAPSHGRSPLVVLREAEQALRIARESGPEMIQCASDLPQARPVAFLSDEDRFSD